CCHYFWQKLGNYLRRRLDSYRTSDHLTPGRLHFFNVAFYLATARIIHAVGAIVPCMLRLRRKWSFYTRFVCFACAEAHAKHTKRVLQLPVAFGDPPVRCYRENSACSFAAHSLYPRTYPYIRCSHRPGSVHASSHRYTY